MGQRGLILDKASYIAQSHAAQHNQICKNTKFRHCGIYAIPFPDYQKQLCSKERDGACQLDARDYFSGFTLK